MNCPHCGAEVQPGQKFCTSCGTALNQENSTFVDNTNPQGAPLAGSGSSFTHSSTTVETNSSYTQGSGSSYTQPTPVSGTDTGYTGGYSQQSYNIPPAGPNVSYTSQYHDRQNSPGKTGLSIFLIIAGILVIVVAGFAAVIVKMQKTIQKAAENTDNYEYDWDDGEWDDYDWDEYEFDDYFDDDNLDFDFDYDFDYDIDGFGDSFDDIGDDIVDSIESGDYSTINYEFVDVKYGTNSTTVIPNGKLNGSTALFFGKDVKGLCDYVDNEVLEKGRTINRDMLYDLLSVFFVDPEFYSDEEFDDMEMNLVYALATANNFHDMKVKINSAEFDNSKQSEYKFHVTAEGKEDIWIIDLKKHTVFFNDGATEYTSDMYDQNNLAVWMTAVEQYFGK